MFQHEGAIRQHPCTLCLGTTRFMTRASKGTVLLLPPRAQTCIRVELLPHSSQGLLSKPCKKWVTQCCTVIARACRHLVARAKHTLAFWTATRHTSQSRNAADMMPSKTHAPTSQAAVAQLTAHTHDSRQAHPPAHQLDSKRAECL